MAKKIKPIPHEMGIKCFAAIFSMLNNGTDHVIATRQMKKKLRVHFKEDTTASVSHVQIVQYNAPPKSSPISINERAKLDSHIQHELKNGEWDS